MVEKMEAAGLSGELQLLEGRIRLAGKEIDLVRIRSIQFKPAGWLSSGYVEFGLQGIEAEAVRFTRKQQPQFERLIMALREQLVRPEGVKETRFSLDTLPRLASLRDEGIITEPEFQRKKRRMMGS